MTNKQRETIRKMKKSLDNFRRKGYDDVKYLVQSNNKEVKEAFDNGYKAGYKFAKSVLNEEGKRE